MYTKIKPYQCGLYLCNVQCSVKSVINVLSTNAAEKPDSVSGIKCSIAHSVLVLKKSMKRK